MTRLVVFAPNVGVGGGLVLLRAMLRSAPHDMPVVALLDERGRKAVELDRPDITIHWFRSSVSGRWRAERTLASIVSDGDTVLCFHSLPPIFARRATILCYVHSPILVGLVDRSRLSRWVRLRSMIERCIFVLFANRIERFIVQTPTMATMLRRLLGPNNDSSIVVLPFLDPNALPPAASDRVPKPKPVFDFIYVSDGAAHKNHSTLFAAWEILADRGAFPTLALTLHPLRDQELRRELAMRVQRSGIRITDLGQMEHERVLELYGQSQAMIFASYAETFGIPLIEAQVAGLPILAAERDFVRDVCIPTLTFDPHSARSIADAVLRFLGRGEAAFAPLAPDAFIAEIQKMVQPGKS